ncbi:conjugal transfer protein TraI [Phocaeicola coprophilus]|uniref:conjugal transfer protein TraI n=1 Tax=Phocaeicola coprophilus TaxID=387090 RepID=UPI003AB65FE2
MSRFHNRNFELLEPYDAKVSCTVLRGERGSNTPDLPDKEYYDGLRKVKNLVRDARKVQQTILMVGDITEIYVTSYERMLSDPYFTPEELSAIALGYTKLLEESANLLTDLKTVVNENGLSMNDKERMDIIDRCYTDMLQYRSLVQYYTNKNIGVSYLRAKKQNDLDRVMALYGSPNERYW